jgi:hypothetical protein
LGLTYDVSFELSLFDRLPAGWFHVNVTSTPQKIDDALSASLRVLRGLRAQAIMQRELLRAKRTLVTRHETDLKDNAYWLGLLTHLQSEAVPLKGVECLRDLRAALDAATIDDMYDAYDQFDLSDEAVFTCVGVSGKDGTVRESPILRGRSGIKRNGVVDVAAAAAAPEGQSSPSQVDPEAFMAAIKSFMQQTVGVQSGTPPPPPPGSGGQ